MMRAVDFADKESLVNLLFLVQSGFISCRKAATVLQAVHNEEFLCKGCCEPATCADREGTPLCSDCAKAKLE
ncbi:MAG: hypothetical protein IAE97_00310 [Chthoniobacterales bacterium]|nr:hypothetical protein [Chthoniobacterales bacterium]